MRLVGIAAAGLVVLAGVEYWDVAYPDIDPATCAADAPVTATAAMQTAGGVIHSLSTESPDPARVAKDTRGVMTVLSVWGGTLTAAMRGEPRPPVADQWEARVVAASTCVAPAPTDLGPVLVNDTGTLPAGKPGPWGGHQNGRIPAPALCPLPGDPGEILRCDAAAAFGQMSAAYAERFGTPISVTDSYRDYAGQVRCRQEKGSMCATPGTSNHGWGMALDLGGGINRFGTAEHEWMRANGGQYGWVHPAWAQASGSKPEAWHFEFHPGGVSAG